MVTMAGCHRSLIQPYLWLVATYLPPKGSRRCYGRDLGAVSTKSLFKRRSAPCTAFNAFVHAAQKRRTERFSFTSLIRILACIHRYTASICWLHHLASDTWTSSLVAPTILLENECKVNSASCRVSGGCGRSPGSAATTPPGKWSQWGRPSTAISHLCLVEWLGRMEFSLSFFYIFKSKKAKNQN